MREENIDWDNEIGLWLKDIPYLWSKKGSNFKTGWDQYKRAYLVPKYFSKLTQHFLQIRVQGIHCKDVRDYFSILRTRKISNNLTFSNKEIRINGYRVFVPESFLQRPQKRDEIELSDLYDYIGVPIPKTEDFKQWRTKLLIKDEKDRPPPPFLDIDISEPLKDDHPHPILEKIATRQIYMMLWYMKIVKENPGVCMPVITKDYINTRDFVSSYSLSVFIKKRDFSDIYINEIFKPQYQRVMKRCMADKNINIIFLPVIWQYFWFDVPSAHQNFFVINKYHVKEDGSYNIYIFDPWGKTQYFESMNVVHDIIKYIGLDNYKWNIIPSVDWCPVQSFQRLETKEIREGDYGGFCTEWTFWVLETFIKYTEEDYSKLIRSAANSLAKRDPSFKSFIRRYAKAVEEYGKEMKSKLGIEFKTPKNAIRGYKGKLTKSDVEKFREYVKSHQ